MKNKKFLLVALMLAAALTLAACAPKAPQATATPAPVATEVPATDAPTATEAAEAGAQDMTVAQLAEFNGKDGKPAYIAVDGVIYDVTNAAPWNGGAHNGFEAGKDLTEEIKTKSPHGVVKLEGLPVIGKLIP